MTLSLPIPDREAVSRWLGTAPPAVVLSICLTATGALGTWTWLIAAEVRDQRAIAAVAAEQARAANLSQQNVEAQLSRVNDKLDRLIEVVADLRVDTADRPARRPRTAREKN